MQKNDMGGCGTCAYSGRDEKRKTKGRKMKDENKKKVQKN